MGNRLGVSQKSFVGPGLPVLPASNFPLRVIFYHPDLRFPLAFKLWGVALALWGVVGLVYWHPTGNASPTHARRAEKKITRRPDWAGRSSQVPPGHEQGK